MYKDTPQAFYAQLLDLVQTQRPVRTRYQLLRDIFRRLAEESVWDAPIRVAGLFAKVDYVLKQHNVPRAKARIIHDARHSLNEMGHKSETELERLFLYDVKATALFVLCVFPEVPIPADLNNRLPQEYRSTKWQKFNENHIYCIVTRWDDEYIYAIEEQNASELTISYSKDNKYLTRGGKHDWSYLAKILSADAALNLLRVRIENDICYPELIIFEPDYLINVTTITSCFETYAESPYIHLINKLKPQANNRYTHLGNLSGQFLDDTVHHRRLTYEESWAEFLQKNAIGVMSCPELLTLRGYSQFEDDARKQKTNIDHLIGEDLHHLPDIEKYDPKDIILEPTFFSELLGIQGRLDFLWETRDPDVSKRHSIIIEQKSGKGQKVWPPVPEADPDVPEAREPHWVQLILYRALFIYEFQKYAESLENVMLLYSQYGKGLISKAYSPELMLRAIRMRNLLAWCEIQYSREGMGILTRLTPEAFRKKKLTDNFWNTYIKPGLTDILSPIRSASPLEQAYYLRFLQFVEREQFIAKIGNREKEDSGFASAWHSTMEDKMAAGNIFVGRAHPQFQAPSVFPQGGGMEVTLSASYSLPSPLAKDIDALAPLGERDGERGFNFRLGDIVILYPFKPGTQPNPCAQMVIRASIIDMTEQGMSLQLRNAQTDVAAIFSRYPDMLWAVEHDMFESSNSALYSGLQSFLSASQERRDLILSQRLPQVDTSVSIKGEYGAFNTLVTRAKQARDLFLIIGPPGTGKTSYGLLNQLKEELLEPDHSVLLMSYTNRAVDEICSKLVEEDIDFIRIGNELSTSPEYRGHILSNRLRAMPSKGAAGFIKNLLHTTRVFCGTTASLNANINILSLKHFDLAIIDESSQILEPHLIGLLSARNGECNAISRFIFIGDHKQLPAVVQQSQEDSVVTDPRLNAINLTDCRLSLFERLLKTFRLPKDSASDDNFGYDPRFVYMLTKQGRMHQDISEFPNHAFYGGRLDVVPLDHQQLPTVSAHSTNGIVNMLTSHRIVFINSSRESSSVNAVSTNFKTNDIEAQMIAATVQQICRLAPSSPSIGIIVPYRNQISNVRNAIERLTSAALLSQDGGIIIDTVERFQGSQCDYILYGFTVSQRYQLNFLTSNTFEEDGLVIDRKLNVAMTRARLNLILIGNAPLLSEDVTFHHLIDFVRSKGGYYDLSPEDYCNGRF